MLCHNQIWRCGCKGIESVTSALRVFSAGSELNHLLTAFSLLTHFSDYRTGLRQTRTSESVRHVVYILLTPRSRFSLRTTTPSSFLASFLRPTIARGQSAKLSCTGLLYYNTVSLLLCRAIDPMYIVLECPYLGTSFVTYNGTQTRRWMSIFSHMSPSHSVRRIPALINDRSSRDA